MSKYNQDILNHYGIVKEQMGKSASGRLSPEMRDIWKSTKGQLEATKMHCEDMINDLTNGRFGRLVRDVEMLKSNAKVAEVILKRDMKKYEKSGARLASSTKTADENKAEMIGNEVLKGLKGRWDSMADFDGGEYIFSWGRSTDPQAMTSGEIVNAEKTITKVLAKHGLRGAARIHGRGNKITFDVTAR